MKKLKSLLNIGILTFWLSIFIVSCEKDENITTEQQNPQSVHRISLNDFNSSIKKDESYNKLQSYFYSNKKK